MNRFLPTALLFVLVPVTTLLGQTFSANVVGYVDLQLYPGSNLVANPLNAASNTVGALFGSVPGGSMFLPWNQGTESFGPTNHFSKASGWSNPDELLVQPNGGFLIVTAATKLSFHGIPWWITPGPRCVEYPSGESVSSWFWPVVIFDAPCVSGIPDGTTIIQWNPESQRYNDGKTYFGGFGWVPAEPVISPGTAFRINSPGAFATPRVSPSLLFWPDTALAHGRPSGVIQNMGRSGPDMTFQLDAGTTNGYSLLSSANLHSGVWQILEQGSIAPVTFRIPATNSLRFFKVHPRYVGPSPYLISRTRTGSAFSFDFFAPSNATYQVQRSADPMTSYHTITNVPADAETLVTVTDGGATGAAGYYRVVY